MLHTQNMNFWCCIKIVIIMLVNIILYKKPGNIQFTFSCPLITTCLFRQRLFLWRVFFPLKHLCFICSFCVMPEVGCCCMPLWFWVTSDSWGLELQGSYRLRPLGCSHCYMSTHGWDLLYLSTTASIKMKSGNAPSSYIHTYVHSYSLFLTLFSLR